MPSNAHDPLLGEFSQERVVASAASFPTLQWLAGQPALGGESQSPVVTGGWFIEDRHLEAANISARPAPAGFVTIRPRLGGKAVEGWGAAALHFCFLRSDFWWEDRETGQAYPPDEYQRRRDAADGTALRLRGRARALVAVKELMDAGHEQPFAVSVHGTFSRDLGRVLKGAQRMADEATRLRRQAGHDGAVPREAFWVRVYAGDFVERGGGTQVSTVAPLLAEIPDAPDRDFLVDSLVPDTHRRPGGTWDQWMADYGPAWEARAKGSDDADAALPSGEPLRKAQREALETGRSLMRLHLQRARPVLERPDDPAPEALRRTLWREMQEIFGFTPDEAAAAIRDLAGWLGLPERPTMHTVEVEAMRAFVVDQETSLAIYATLAQR